MANNLRGRYAKVNAEIIDNMFRQAQRKNEIYRNKRRVRPMTKGEFRYAVMRDLCIPEDDSYE